jgi:hypothetical protein
MDMQDAAHETRRDVIKESIDELSKRQLGWWIFSDTVIHCMCGESMIIGAYIEDGHKDTFECDKCHQKWFAKLTVKKISNEA